MGDTGLDVVTGAFGYTGRYITRRLLAAGRRVLTLTSRPLGDSPFGRQVDALPLDFDRPERLREHLRGASTLYNTYWVRFSYGPATFDAAVENTRTLLRAAREAGVERVVHVSITNPSEAPGLPYFHGKALLEAAVQDCGLSYAIVRPTVIFGPEDILINNIAWLLRRCPVFGVFGRGDYPVQPIFVEDFADLAVQAGRQRGNVVMDAAGPEVFSFAELVHLIRQAIGSRTRVVSVPPAVALLAARLIDGWVGDVVITRDEIRGLMAGLLVSNESPRGPTSLSDWLRRHADSVGVAYASELDRHYRSRRAQRSA